jgi:hypothetical protein
MKQLAILLLFALTFSGCQTKTKEQAKFELKGNISGLAGGTKVYLHDYYSQPSTSDSTIVSAGTFTFKGDYPQPTELHFAIEGGEEYIAIYVENSKMTITGDAKKLKEAIIGGSKSHDGYDIYYKAYKALRVDFDKNTPVIKTKEDFEKYKAIFTKQSLEFRKKLSEMEKRYLEENPELHYAAVLSVRKMTGLSIEEMEKYVKTLHPSILKNHVVKEKLKQIEYMKTVEVGLEQMMAGVENIAYKVDQTFKGKSVKDMVYLASFKNDDLCALRSDGQVQVVANNGTVKNAFSPKLNGKPASIGVDDSDNIYVCTTLMKKIKKKIRGKVIVRETPEGVKCYKLDKNGKLIKEFSFPDLKTASGLRIHKNRIIISDCGKAKISMFDSETGEQVAVMEGMRPCCGILDFSINNKDQILVANLGAFRVQGYDMNGKNILAFGQRGKTLNDFHGCCNPVSVASLNSGAIVTVEKDPTRIKVYSKEGAKQIQGIQELVKGCSYIPMVVDSKDNLYLASKEKGLVKCISIN